ncbi:MAG: OsmC family protein [Bryobacteraceae bacterium]
MGDESQDKFHSVTWAGDEFLKVSTASGHELTVDVKSGRRAAAGPLELFISGLASCTAADVISILLKKREKVTGYKVEVRTQRREEHPKSFSRIVLTHIVEGHGISPEAVARAIDLSTNKYCSAVSTVRPTAEVVTEYRIVELDQVPVAAT